MVTLPKLIQKLCFIDLVPWARPFAENGKEWFKKEKDATLLSFLALTIKNNKQYIFMPWCGDLNPDCQIVSFNVDIWWSNPADVLK